jgi:hypothetical protein
LFAAFAGVQLGVLAANHAPVLTGGNAAIPNALVFMENATPAHVSASSGAISILAGGSNQNVTLTPSGTGLITSASPLYLNPAAAPGVNQIKLQANAAGALALLSEAADDQEMLWDAEYSGAAYVARSTTAARLMKSGSVFRIDYANGLTAGSTFVWPGTSSLTVDLTTGRVGFGGNASPGYPVDATGAINASTGFSVGGAAGVTHSQTMKNSAGTTCTETFSGGLLTSSSC